MFIFALIANATYVGRLGFPSLASIFHPVILKKPTLSNLTPLLFCVCAVFLYELSNGKVSELICHGFWMPLFAWHWTYSYPVYLAKFQFTLTLVALLPPTLLSVGLYLEKLLRVGRHFYFKIKSYIIQH